MLQLLVVASLAAAPIKVGLPGLTGLQMSPEALSYFSEHLGTQLETRGIDCVSQGEISTLLGIERQKQLLGCADDGSSCMLELANAMGVDAIIVGSVGKFGDTYQINVKALRSSGQQLGQFTRQVDGERTVLAALSDAADSLSEQLQRALRPGAPPSTGIRRTWALVPAALGVVSFGVATGLLVDVMNKEAALRGPAGGVSTLTPDQAQQTLAAGLAERTAGYVLLGVGAAAVTGAALLWFLGSDGSSPPPVAFSVGPSGLVVSGVFP